MTRYRLGPAGHVAPDIVKRTYSKPDRKLQLRFEEWLEKETPEKLEWKFGSSFQAAIKAVSNLEANVDEAHGLLIQYLDHPQIVEAGLFLSAIYNQQPDTTIVYDIETTRPINCIGYRLAERKTLTLNAQSGDYTGWDSLGMIITNAQSGDWTGLYSSGVVITNAQSGNWTGGSSSGLTITNAQSGHNTGWESSGIIITNAPNKEGTGWGSSGILLARTTPEGIGENSARVLLPNDIKANEQLDEYLAQLCKTTKAIRTVDDIAAFKETYGKKPQEKIKKDIERLLESQ